MLTVWKKGNTRNPLINWYYSLANTLTIHCYFVDLYSTIKRGKQFCFSFCDGATEVYHAELLRTKSWTFDTFQKFIRQVEHQSRKKLKHLRTDFEREYILKENVNWEMSAPYTPEQNRKTERLNYILMSTVWFILAAIHLPRTLYDELIKTVAYSKN